MEKVVLKKSLKDKDSDSEYWRTKTPQERLEEIEILRLNYFALLKAKDKNAEYRLQRVYKIIDRKKS